MQTIPTTFAAVLTVIILSTMARAREKAAGPEILLTIAGREYPAVLHDTPALAHDGARVRNGYRKGQPAYRIPGQDFVTLMDEEEIGLRITGTVVLGELTGLYEPHFNLGSSITGRISRAEQ